MVKKYKAFIFKLFFLIDVCTLSLSFAVVCFYYEQFHYLWKCLLGDETSFAVHRIASKDCLWVPLILVPIVTSIFYIRKVYEPFKYVSILSIVFNVMTANLFGSIVLSWFIFISKIDNVNRFFIVSLFALSVILQIVVKIVLSYAIRYMQYKGYNHRHILIVGTGKRAVNCIETIRKNNHWGIEVFGIIDNDPEKLGDEVDGVKVIGLISDMPALLRKHVIDQVIFVVPRSWLCIIEDPVLFCSTLGVKIAIAVDLFDSCMLISKRNFTDVGGLPIIEFSSTLGEPWQLFVKRALDLIFASFLLIITIPVHIATAVVIKISSSGPVIFKQKRMGLNGRGFIFYKFRTMVVDAEKTQKEMAEFNEMDGPVFKIRKDPRITWIGSCIRKFSIDELPQLINVLNGDMSLVGPRPPIPGEVDLYDHWQRRRLSVKPGLTCLWQVKGRNEVGFDEWMKLDLQYIDNWCLWLDFKILLMTIPAVIFCKGAR